MNDKELCQKHLLHAPSMLKEDCPCCQLEAQLDKVGLYIRHKPDCEIDDNAWYVDHDHPYAGHCTCGLQQALENK